ncbi:MAG: hypothetical protein IJI14_08210 [Anaerolineaceae bacterium]|nr:hypothetical protein [Anaerolineaceae bacterium]
MCNSLFENLSGKECVLALVIILLLCSVLSAAGADTSVAIPGYESPVYDTPVVDANGNHTLTLTNTHRPELIEVTYLRYTHCCRKQRRCCR